MPSPLPYSITSKSQVLPTGGDPTSVGMPGGGEHEATLESVHHNRSQQKVMGRIVNTTSLPKQHRLVFSHWLDLLELVTDGSGLYLEAPPRGRGPPEEAQPGERCHTRSVLVFS